MKNARFLLIGGLTFLCIGTLMADSKETFPSVGKTYVIHRFNNENSYIYELNGMLYAAPKTNTQKQYWQFVPTGKDNCYYIQNVTTKRYVQSANVTIESQIKTGTTPVEFEIKTNRTSGAAPYGYYYICSTDQTIDTSKDGTLGLNYQQSSGKVVAYHIRYNRGNSYWDIIETEYDYEAPQPITRSEFSKRLGIYILPCGDKSDPYLTSLTIEGEAENVTNKLNYTSHTQPSNYYVMVRKDTAEVTLDTDFTLSYEATKMNKDFTISAYFDWDGDGIFEDKQDFLNETNGKATIHVPKTAQTGKHRMRIRLTDNGLEGADDDVHGMAYDFQLWISPSKTIDAVDNVTTRQKLSTPTPYNMEGKRINLANHKGIYIQKGKKSIK